MAKARTKKKPTETTTGSMRPTAADAAPPGRALEALGIAMLLGALALCFALFSFDPTDPSGAQNLVGPLGVGVAGAILGGIGVAGYVVSLLCVGLAGATLFGKVRWPSFLAVAAALGITVGACLLAHLVVGDSGALGHPAGGVVGLVLGELLVSIAGPAGAALCGVGLVLLGVLGISNLSFSVAMQEGFQGLARAGRAAGGRLQVWREASAAARQREAELVEAARSRRAQDAMERDAREQALADDLEEKKRLAVLKATAKAEEKALAKIAALDAKARVEAGTDDADADDEPEAEVDAGSDAASGEVADEAAPEAAAAEPVLAAEPEVTVDADEATPDPDEVELGIPGPAAEPQILIRSDLPSLSDDLSEDDWDEDAAAAVADERGFADEATTDAIEVVDGADAIEDIVRRTQLPAAAPAETSAPGLEVSASAILDAAPEHDAAAEHDAAPEAQAAPSSPALAEAETGELVIHERKAVETDFEDDAGPIKLPKQQPEKPVFELPPVNLLDYEGEAPAEIDGLQLKSRATLLEEKLKTYGVDGKVTAIRPGPVVTTYEYQPAPGVKVSKIQNLSDDIAMSMEAVRVRIVAPIPGRGVVGIELPNDKRENVYLKEVVAHDRFKKSKSLLTLALGKDSEGDVQVRDLQKMPHLMIAGTTGSGKSVAINTMVLSVLYKATPEEVKFIMIDPKMLELSLYNDIPHQLLPVVTDPKKASLALQWAVDEMERRYQLLSEFKVRDIGGFNKKLLKLNKQREEMAKEAELEEQEWAEKAANRELIRDPWRGKDLPEKMPYIVVLIDEFADLMAVAGKDVEMSVQRLAQKARAAGIHVLLATQRPSTDVITGVIKNNFPSRVSFRVASRHDSQTILNTPGAENLLGLGDSLFLSVASPTPERIHGAFVSEDEVERVVEFWKAQAKPVYDESILRAQEGDPDAEGFSEEDRDEHYDMAVQIVCETRRASISALQRRLRVGYNRAARMIEMMEFEGIVGSPSGPKGEREVIAPPIHADGPPRS